jgi:hypothetical protein
MALFITICHPACLLLLLQFLLLMLVLLVFLLMTWTEAGGTSFRGQSIMCDTYIYTSLLRTRVPEDRRAEVAMKFRVTDGLRGVFTN